MSDHCWYVMKDFPTRIFHNTEASIIKYSTNPTYRMYTALPGEFSDEVREWFCNKNLILSGAIIFSRKHITENGSPHVDGGGIDSNGAIRFRTAAINIEYTGRATMYFYRGDTHAGYPLTAAANQIYYYFPKITDDDIMDVNSFDSGPCIVRTDVIHKVVCNEIPRLLISLRFLDLTEGRHLSWDESIDRLKDCIIPRE